MLKHEVLAWKGFMGRPAQISRFINKEIKVQES